MDLYGADDFVLNTMEAVEGTIDLEQLKTGRYILLSVECMDDGTVIDNPNIHAGDTIRLYHIRTDGLFGSIGESYEFTIMAEVRKNENTFLFVEASAI